MSTTPINFADLIADHIQAEKNQKAAENAAKLDADHAYMTAYLEAIRPLTTVIKQVVERYPKLAQSVHDLESRYHGHNASTHFYISGNDTVTIRWRQESPRLALVARTYGFFHSGPRVLAESDNAEDLIPELIRLLAGVVKSL